MSKDKNREEAYYVLAHDARRMTPWPKTFAEAKLLQETLRDQVEILKFSPQEKLFLHLKKIDFVAGCDVSFSQNSDILYAAVVVLSFPELILLEVATAVATAMFPYVPGYLSFREGPVLLEAFEKLKHAPQVLICDGHGIAHPRRFGLASHLGVVLQIPTIGCAKKKLIGSFMNPKMKKGSSCDLKDESFSVIGKVVRSKKKIKPVFVSVGHKISLELAVGLILKCCKKYRLPEPTRLAHIEVNKLRKKSERKK